MLLFMLPLFLLLHLIFFCSKAKKKSKEFKSSSAKLPPALPPKSAEEIAKEEEERKREEEYKREWDKKKKAKEKAEVEKLSAQLPCEEKAGKGDCKFHDKIDKHFDEEQLKIEKKYLHQFNVFGWLDAVSYRMKTTLSRLKEVKNDHPCLAQPEKLEKFNECLQKHGKKMEELSKLLDDYKSQFKKKDICACSDIEDICPYSCLDKKHDFRFHYDLRQQDKEWAARMKLHPELVPPEYKEWKWEAGQE